MKTARIALLLLVAAALIVPAVAGEGQKCTADTQTCLNQLAASFKDRGWVGIEMEQDEEKGMLKVVRVVPDSPAMEAGMQVGDVLVAMNGLEFSPDNKEKMYEARKQMTPGAAVTYTVERQGCCHKKGGATDVRLTLGELPQDVMMAWVGQHMLEHVAIEVAEN